MDIRYRHGDRPVQVEIEEAPEGWRVRLPDAAPRVVSARRLPGGDLEVAVHEASGLRVFRIAVSRSGSSIQLACGGRVWTFTPEQSARSEPTAPTSSGALTAPMVGLVTDVLVSLGDRVQQGQPLVLVEAMKVIATVAAPFAGAVSRLYVAKGQQVSYGAPLLDVAAAEEG